MWVLIIIVVVGSVMLFNYSSDKNKLHNQISQLGGMEVVFQDFISCVEDDFKEYRILRKTDVELEISAKSYDGQSFIFGIKQGFSGIVSFRCDRSRSNNINAEIVVQGNLSNQIASYLMIIEALKEKYTFKTRNDAARE